MKVFIAFFTVKLYNENVPYIIEEKVVMYLKDLGNKKIMAKNLKRLMKENNVSAKELSRTLDFPYTTLLSWLKADNYPRIDKIDAMADYFGVLKSELIEEKLTEEKEKDNDIMADIIVRMRTDEDFFTLVKSISKLDAADVKRYQAVLNAMKQ